MRILTLLCMIVYTDHSFAQIPSASEKTRIILTSDAEIDDECSFVRCLLYANDFDIEGIITTSSQYHAHDHNWAGDDWYVKYLDAYTEIYPNLIKHDTSYPTSDYLKERAFLGNVEKEGEMDSITPGSQHIVRVLLDESDDRPVWLQAWGGMNTIARALKTIEEEHPDKMTYVGNKIRFFFIWEQDETFQTYIRPKWGMYNIPTIISDQFIALFYKWKEYIPAEQQKFLVGEWINENIKINHGPLCSLYKSQDNGDFRSEGDSPSFMHAIPTGLRNLESPDWGGWAGRYTNIRDNTWLDPVAEPGYQYPEGRWYTNTAWGRERLRKEILNDTVLTAYLKPIWRWMETFQNDFASRADWCVKSFEESNHPPVIVLDNEADLKVRPGTSVELSAQGTSDPDGDSLTYRWWQYREAGSYDGIIEILDAGKQEASFTVPDNFHKGKTIHIICEVTDSGAPQLTRYARVVIESDTTFVTEMVNRGFESSGLYLKSIHPNPFNPVATLGYRLNKPNKVISKIYNLSDQEIETLVDQYQTVGEHEITWQPQRLPCGIYFCRLLAGINSETMKILLQ
ncbi:MAG: nucleoside hydrolase-like domain-containing protein [Bacteroidota bacterium]